MTDRPLATLSIGAAVTVALLAGCGGGEDRSAGRPEPAPASSATPTVSPTPESPAAPPGESRSRPPGESPSPGSRGDAVRSACRDGDCQVELRSGESIPLDRRFGMEPISVKAERGEVEFRTRSGGSEMQSSLSASPGGDSRVTFNDITVRLLGVHGDRVTVRVSHR
jgi:hypothetical protein